VRRATNDEELEGLAFAPPAAERQVVRRRNSGMRMKGRLIFATGFASLLACGESPNQPPTGGVTLTASISHAMDGGAQITAQFKNHGETIVYAQDVCDSLYRGVFVGFTSPSGDYLRIRSPRADEVCAVTVPRICRSGATVSATIPISGFLYDIDSHSVPMVDGAWTAIVWFSFGGAAQGAIDQRLERRIAFDWPLSAMSSNNALHAPGAGTAQR
jgi:hypothetical protein